MKKISNIVNVVTRRYHILTAVVFLVGMIVCSSCVTKHPELIISENISANISTSPSNVTVAVDDQVIGIAPMSYQFNFSTQPVYMLRFSKKDYLPTTIEINVKVLERWAGNIHVALTEHPLLAVTSASYSANKWISLKLMPDVQEEEAWDRLVALIKTKYPRIRKINGNNGYMETYFKENTYSLPNGNVFLRSRLKTKFIQEYPVVLMGYYLQTEMSYDGIIWHEYDRVLKSDVHMLNSIKKQFGIRR